MVFIYLNNVQMFVWSAESSKYGELEMDSLERLRSFMIAFADVRQHNPKYETVSDLHAYQVALETHKQYLMALDVIKVKAPIDVLAVTKLHTVTDPSGCMALFSGRQADSDFSVYSRPSNS